MIRSKKQLGKRLCVSGDYGYHSGIDRDDSKWVGFRHIVGMSVEVYELVSVNEEAVQVCLSGPQSQEKK